jgi:serine/threonine-protein kinase HipA
MSSRKTLDVFLRGARIGEMKGSGLRLSFQYDRATLAEYGAGSILLSLSMPVSRNKIDGPEVYDFFEDGSHAS